MKKIHKVVGVKVKCIKCEVDKDRKDFYVDDRNILRGGLDSWCKRCQIKRVTIYKKNNLEVARSAVNNYNYRAKREVYDHYGRICKCCGEETIEFLTIDHIEGGGSAHRKEIGFGKRFYRWLVVNKFPKGFRTLCMNCQFGTRYNNICPHQRVKCEK